MTSNNCYTYENNKMESKTCRVCLNNSGSISLFQNNDGVKLSAKLIRCVNLTISVMDGLPDHICTLCESELAIAYAFIIKCEASDMILQNHRIIETIPDEPYEITNKPQLIKNEPGLSVLDVNTDNITKKEIKMEQENDCGSNNNLQYIHDDSDTLDVTDDVDIKLPKVKHKKSIAYLGKVYKPIKQQTSGKMQCTQCGLILVSTSAMDIHVRTHTGEKPYICVICDKRFGRKSGLFRHEETHKLIRSTKNKDKDIIIKNRRKKIKCESCNYMANCPSALRVHMLSHTGDKPYKCLKCDKSFRYKASLKTHNERHYNRKIKHKHMFTCDVCGRIFARKNAIINHIRIHTGEKPFSCLFCPQRFVQLSSLIRHKRIHTNERPFSCHVCGKTARDKSEITMHMVVHSDERNFTCNICNKAVKTKNALKTHMELHRQERNHVCSFCGKTFSTRGNMTLHVKKVHSEKSGQCTVCYKTFSDLSVHMRKHTGEKPFMCSYCDKAFSTNNSLQKHTIFRHDKPHKFVCAIGGCTKTFPIPSMLEFHLLKQHTRQTPYNCQQCSKGFFRSCDLMKHSRVYHDNKIPEKSLISSRS